MAPKKATPRRTGTGAAKSAATSPPDVDGVPAATAPTRAIPDDPVDPRLTLEGAKLLPDGKVDIEAYEDLMPHFAGEPAPDQHPDPERPGLQYGEKLPKGVRMWDDIRANAVNKDGSARTGAGWIACRSTKDDGKQEKWFNIRTCGSWRMAFLLARLQRAQWESRANWLKEDITSTGGFQGDAAPSTPVPMPKLVKKTPQKRQVPPPSASASAGATPQKQQRVGDAGVKEDQAGAQKKPFITPDMIAGSVRLQAILAARQKQT